MNTQLPRVSQPFNLSSATFSLLLLIALAFLAPPGVAQNFEGGTRLVFSLDLKQALQNGQITREQFENPESVLSDVAQIALERVDPNRGTFTGRKYGSRVHQIDAQTFGIEFPPGSGDSMSVQELTQMTRSLVEIPGHMEFLTQASPERDFIGSSFDAEHGKAIGWYKRGGISGLDTFNTQSARKGGPVPGTRWFSTTDHDPSILNGEDFLVCLVKHRNPRWVFTGYDLRTVSRTKDALGQPALAIEFTEERAEDFGDFTEAHAGQQLAIVRDGTLVSMARISKRLPASIIVTGGTTGFKLAEVEALVAILRSGSTPIVPHFERAETIGKETAK